MSQCPYPSKRCRTSLLPRETTQRTNPMLNLPVEIILRIVEELDWDPITIGNFMRTSKRNASAILTNETSLTHHFTSPIPSTYPSTLLSSAPSPRAYIDPLPIETTVYRLLRALPYSTQIPSFGDFTASFRHAMTTHHPDTILSVGTSVLLHRAFGEATFALSFAYQRQAPRPLLPFRVAPKLAEVVERGSFRYVEEVYLRERIKTELSRSRLFDLHRVETGALFHVQPTLCYCCHTAALEMHKWRGVEVLWEMWDARIGNASSPPSTTTVGSGCGQICSTPSECTARNNVEAWISLQSPDTLAHLLLIIWIASNLYDYSQTQIPSSGCEHGAHTQGHNATSAPTRSLNERDEYWMRVEMECIFRELCLENGPFFLYACCPRREGDGRKEEERRGWAGKLIERGLQRLHAYEAGEIVDEAQGEEESRELPLPVTAAIGDGARQLDGFSTFTSSNTLPNTTTAAPQTPPAPIPAPPRITLQATLLQRFCTLQNCSLTHGWDEVLRLNATAIHDLKLKLDAEKKQAERANQAAEKVAREKAENEAVRLIEEGFQRVEEKEKGEKKEVARPQGWPEGWGPTQLTKEKEVQEARDILQYFQNMKGIGGVEVGGPSTAGFPRQGSASRNANGSGSGEQARKDAFITSTGTGTDANLLFKGRVASGFLVDHLEKGKGKGKEVDREGANVLLPTPMAPIPICDEEHGEDGEETPCVLDELLWGVEEEDDGKWEAQRQCEFIGSGERGWSYYGKGKDPG